MSMKQMRMGMPSLMKEGTKTMSGVQEAVIRSIQACKNLSQITRTSLGPNAMNKMVINHLDKIFVTSDAATIMKEMEVVHPAAKMVVLASEMQEKEIGDGSNLVVSFAGELLTLAEALLSQGLHPADIITGYQMALNYALKTLNDIVVMELKPEDMNNDIKLKTGIKASLAAKDYGHEVILSSLIGQACKSVMPSNPHNFDVDNVRVCKLLAGNITDSYVVYGMVVNRDTEGIIKSVDNARIGVFQCAIDQSSSDTKGSVLMESAKDLLNYNASEEKQIEEQISAIAMSGVNVVITAGNISDIALHFLEKNKILTLKIQSKFELRRICRCIGARPQQKLGAVSREYQGYCERVYASEISSHKVTIFKHEKDVTGVATIVLRGSTDNILNDLERAVDDGVNVIKAMGRDGRFLAGAGACEIELAKRINEFGNSCAGLEQYAIKKFAEALEVVPRTLAENVGLNASEIVMKLHATHEKGDSKVGIDIEGGKVRDMTQDNIFDLFATKYRALSLATDVALDVLRVDQIIMAKPAGGPKMPKQGPYDE